MELWPSLSSSSSSKKKQSETDKGKGKSRKRETFSNYPVIDHGAQSAATLIRVGDELEWRSVHSSRKGLLIFQGNSDKIYPSTRPRDVANFNASSSQRVQQGATFLRTFHPDVDIPFDIIKDTIKEDDKNRRRAEEFDPFSGNTLSATYCFDGIKKRAIALAFPTGTLGNELNLSPVTFRVNSVLFEPVVQPTWTFDAPIRQIVTSNPAVNMEERTGAHTLAVRTYGQISVFDIRNQVMAWSEPTKPPFAISDLMSIRANDLQSSSGGSVVDMGFSRLASEDLFLVTERGAGYRCQCLLENGQKIIENIFDSPLPNDCSFWRIISDRTMDGGIVASDRSVHKFDTRSFGTSMDLLEYDDGRNVITSICPTQTDHLFCISTTDQVIWLDERYPKQPLLGWKHYRAFDRSLSVQTIEFENTSIAFLGSSKNNLVTAIAVGKLENGPLQCQMSPRALPASVPGTSLTARTLIRHPGIPSGSFSLLELSAQGSLHRQELRYVTDSSTISPGREHVKGRFDYQWSEDVRQLARREKDLKPDYGKLAGRESARVDLSELYQALFGEEAQESRAKEEEARAERVYETLENMPTFWQRSDTGEEHMRTLFDVAFASGPEPIHEARADFLSGSVLDSARGYRARKQGRIPVAEVAKGAGWHMNIRPILHKISPDMFKEPSTNGTDADEAMVVEPYRVRRDEVVPEADQRENEAREQLALDLALASDVVSPVPIKSPTPQNRAAGTGEVWEGQEDASFLTQETEKLSLSGKEPPHVNFSFLMPVVKDGKKHYRDFEGTEKRKEKEHNEEGGAKEGEGREIAEIPLGVRLLLSEWNLGDDPDTYEYVDPYDLDESQFTKSQAQGQPRRRQQRRPSEETESGPARPSQAQAPPTIIASRTLAAKEKEKETRSAVRMAVSQVEPERESSSQPSMMMAHTQVEPGRFGGRQPVVKKPAKKRMGGF